jgi:hypothetical protein
MFGRSKQPQRPQHTCSCGANHWAFDAARRLWICRACGSTPCAICVKRKATAKCPSRHHAAPSQQDADLATLHRYFNAHDQPSVAVIPFEAWVARVLAGETVGDVLDKARGTIESEILDEELRRLYDAQRAIPDGGCTDAEWQRRMRLPESVAIATGEGSMYEAMGKDPNYPWDCEVSGHVCAHGETACRACGTKVRPPVADYSPASPKARCDHDWHYMTGQYEAYAMCGLCGERARYGRVVPESAPPPPLMAGRAFVAGGAIPPRKPSDARAALPPRYRGERVRCARINHPDSPHPLATLALRDIVRWNDDPIRKGTYGNAVVVHMRDGRTIRGDYVGDTDGIVNDYSRPQAQLDPATREFFEHKSVKVTNAFPPATVTNDTLRDISLK